MFKFLFVYIFSVLLICFFMQDPLSMYLEQKYNSDFGIKKLKEIKIANKGIEFYDFLKFKFAGQEKYKPQEEYIPEPIKITNIIKQEITKNQKQKSDQNKTKIVVKKAKQIRLKAGDEILFIGDSIMQNIAIGSRKLFAKNGIKIIDISKHSTGLVNKKYYNWEEKTSIALENNNKIKLLIALFGANDSWGRSIRGRYREFNTKEWNDFYKNRISEIYQIAKKHNVEVLWLGVPCMKKDDFNEKMNSLNVLFSNLSKNYDETYLDVKNIICTNEIYTTHLKNDNNETVKIRANDGIHISIAGGRIIAKTIFSKIKIDENSSKQ